MSGHNVRFDHVPRRAANDDGEVCFAGTFGDHVKLLQAVYRCHYDSETQYCHDVTQFGGKGEIAVETDELITPNFIIPAKKKFCSTELRVERRKQQKRESWSGFENNFVLHFKNTIKFCHFKIYMEYFQLIHITILCSTAPLIVGIK